ncbi:hypothetical protein CEQ90_12045 [Lewinellaceae bacterium SD302]|nr:hypothetical protein CEQ90_12045 [Lewinellaceae bacterium SD302]
MKYIVTLIICLASLLVMGIALNDDNTIKITATDPIGVNLEMGSGPNCTTSRRICTAQATAQRKRQAGVELFGEMHVNNNNQLVLKFPRSEMQPQVAMEQFKNNQFLLTDHFDLPSEILQEMQIKNQCRIEAGSYPVVDDEDFYIVNLTLSAQE